jgi:hypothetical protein
MKPRSYHGGEFFSIYTIYLSVKNIISGGVFSPLFPFKHNAYVNRQPLNPPSYPHINTKNTDSSDSSEIQ